MDSINVDKEEKVKQDTDEVQIKKEEIDDEEKVENKRKKRRRRRNPEEEAEKFEPTLKRLKEIEKEKLEAKTHGKPLGGKEWKRNRKEKPASQLCAVKQLHPSYKQRMELKKEIDEVKEKEKLIKEQLTQEREVSSHLFCTNIEVFLTCYFRRRKGS